MFDMSYDVDIRQVDQGLARLMLALSERERRRILERIGKYMKRSIRKTIVKGGEPKWAPLAESTIERRMRGRGDKGPTGKKMKKPMGGRKGAIWRMIKHRVGSTTGGGIDAVEIGVGGFLQEFGKGARFTWDPARYLHEGTRHIPARPYIALTARNVREVMRMSGEFLDKALAK